jgi:hypothetical protein
MRIAVHTRQDFTITDQNRLVAAARLLEDSAPGSEDPADATRIALGTLLIEYGSDELAERAEEFGLQAGDSSTVLSREDESEPGAWLDSFPGTGPGRVIHQLDSSAALDMA